MEKIQTSAISEGKKRFIYLGDGKGDYCPSLRLREEDYVMPRKEFPLWDLIVDKREALRAEMREWCNAEELERVLLQIINGDSLPVDGSKADLSISADCKFQTAALSCHKALPKSLPVP